MDKRKKLATALSLLAVTVLLLFGAYAWIDNSQHKTNEAVSASLYDVTLIEDFQEITDWKVKDGEIKKEVRVSNNEEPTDLYGAGDVYVRIQLKEYMEMMDSTYTETDERYMVDTNGKFIVYTATDGATDATTALNLFNAAYPQYANPGRVAVELEDLLTGDKGWFIQTMKSDPNGQYGKKVTYDFNTSGTATSLVDGVTRATADENDDGTTTAFEANKFHNAYNTAECDYTPRIWDSAGNAPAGSDSEVFCNYVSWRLGADVILIDDWDGSSPQAKWIIDTGSAEGWIYWGQALKAGGVTPNVLDAIQLDTQPNGAFYYAIHADLEAASLEDLWDDAPEGLFPVNNVSEEDVEVIALDELGNDVSGTENLLVQADVEKRFRAEVRETGAQIGEKKVTWSIVSDDGLGDLESYIRSVNDTTGVVTIYVSSVDEGRKIKVIASLDIDASKKGQRSFSIEGIHKIEIDRSDLDIYRMITTVTKEFKADVKYAGTTEPEVSWTIHSNGMGTRDISRTLKTKILEPTEVVIPNKVVAESFILRATATVGSSTKADSVVVNIKVRDFDELKGDKSDVGKVFRSDASYETTGPYMNPNQNVRPVDFQVISVDDNGNMLVISDRVLGEERGWEPEGAIYDYPLSNIKKVGNTKLGIDSVLGTSDLGPMWNKVQKVRANAGSIIYGDPNNQMVNQVIVDNVNGVKEAFALSFGDVNLNTGADNGWKVPNDRVGYMVMNDDLGSQAAGTQPWSSPSYWWLRSRGSSNDRAGLVNPNGDLDVLGLNTGLRWYGVRPALILKW